MIKHILYALISWILVLVIRIPLILLGFIAVPLGLTKATWDHHSSVRFTQYNSHRYWTLVTLPKWLWVWSNDRDGMLGDKRGWWDYHCDSGNSQDFDSMFWWAAVRNPVNNLRFVKGISCDVSRATVELLGGQSIVDDETPGWQFLVARGATFNYYQLYWINQYLEIRMGHKIKLSHNSTDWSLEDANKVWKGFTFRIKKA